MLAIKQRRLLRRRRGGGSARRAHTPLPLQNTSSCKVRFCSESESCSPLVKILDGKVQKFVSVNFLDAGLRPMWLQFFLHFLQFKSYRPKTLQIIIIYLCFQSGDEAPPCLDLSLDLFDESTLPSMITGNFISALTRVAKNSIQPSHP